MNIAICPGIHSPQLTASFLRGLEQSKPDLWVNAVVFPTQNYPAYSTKNIEEFLKTHFGLPKTASPIVLISFSAGVVGAFGAAQTWQNEGGVIQAFIALDGWGMPLWGNFPIYRLSHDYFTHWSSALLGGGEESFYADPGVEHLELWRSPQKIQGWCLSAPGCRSRCTAAEFLCQLLLLNIQS
ncbi:MAG: hypothetical protein WA865_05995 [Spirulinaceae cyanobacterium]